MLLFLVRIPFGCCSGQPFKRDCLKLLIYFKDFNKGVLSRNFACSNKECPLPFSADSRNLPNEGVSRGILEHVGDVANPNMLLSKINSLRPFRWCSVPSVFLQLVQGVVFQSDAIAATDVHFHVPDLPHARDGGVEFLVAQDKAQRHLRHVHPGWQDRAQRLDVLYAGEEVLLDKIG